MSNTAFNPSGQTALTPSNVASNFGGFLRNRIINGDFRISNRATSFSTPTSATQYTLDRWKTIYDGTIGAFTISQQTFTPATISPESANFLQWNQTSAGSASTIRELVHCIEDVREFSNQTAVLTFWAKADSTRTLGISLNQNFGSGGSSSVPITALTNPTVSLTTSWQQFTVTFQVPSISGKTIGSGNCLQLIFSLPINVTMTIGFANVQMEVLAATPFEFRPIAFEQAMCSRYFQICPVYVLSNPSVGSVTFESPMRVSPTVSGGGSGFATANASAWGFTCNQTAAGFETLNLEADL